MTPEIVEAERAMRLIEDGERLLRRIEAMPAPQTPRGVVIRAGVILARRCCTLACAHLPDEVCRARLGAGG